MLVPLHCPVPALVPHTISLTHRLHTSHSPGINRTLLNRTAQATSVAPLDWHDSIPTQNPSLHDHTSGEFRCNGGNVDGEVLQAVPPLSHLNVVLSRLPQVLQLLRVLHTLGAISEQKGGSNR